MCQSEWSRRVTKVIAVSVSVLLLCGTAAWAAVRGDAVMYVGGTIQSVPERTKGRLDTTDGEKLIFASPKGGFEIPYAQITSLEYGQKAGRRVGVAIVVSPWMLFSKKRKHFVTIGWTDEQDKPQGVVLELPKKKTKAMLIILEVRSGIKCEYESEEARKHVHG